MTEKVHDSHRKSKSLGLPKLSSKSGGKKLTTGAFVLSHFAGEVAHRTDGWLRKNTDTLHEDLQVCLSSSQSPLLAQLFSVGTINAITGGARRRQARRLRRREVTQLEDLMRSLRATLALCAASSRTTSSSPTASSTRSCSSSCATRGWSTPSAARRGTRRASPETLEAQFAPLCPAKFQNFACSSASPSSPPSTSVRDRPPPARPALTPRRRRLTRLTPSSPSRAFRLPPRPDQGLLQVGEARARRLPRGKKTLDAAFFKKMGRLLALWRFRRGVSAVRCLLYLNAKMRRLRALQFRRSATVAAMVGRSWIRRAKRSTSETIERMQARGRGQVARLKARKMRAASSCSRRAAAASAAWRAAA